MCVGINPEINPPEKVAVKKKFDYLLSKYLVVRSQLVQALKAVLVILDFLDYFLVKSLQPVCCCNYWCHNRQTGKL